MGFIIYYFTLIINPMNRILVRRKWLENNLEIPCHPIYNRLYYDRCVFFFKKKGCIIMWKGGKKPNNDASVCWRIAMTDVCYGWTHQYVKTITMIHVFFKKIRMHQCVKEKNLFEIKKGCFSVWKNCYDRYVFQKKRHQCVKMEKRIKVGCISVSKKYYKTCVSWKELSI